jgi:hypothetical protein
MKMKIRITRIKLTQLSTINIKKKISNIKRIMHGQQNKKNKLVYHPQALQI